MPTTLLNDDGTASMATMIMCSHHAFRRDLACFAKALADSAPGHALHDEWTKFHAALHGHHTVEDTSLFPDLRGKYPELAAAIDKLDAHHRTMTTLLERGDQLFADLANRRGETRDLIGTLAALLAEHLDAEELAIIPHLRGVKEFAAPLTDEMIPVYADGFAWASAGIATAVLDKVFAMLPPALAAKIPAARAAFDERCRKTWGYAHAGASVTSVPAA